MKAIFTSVIFFVLGSTAVAALPQVSAQLNMMGVTRNMTTINPRFQSVSSARITYDQKNLKLTLTRAAVPCAPGMMCIQVMPTPVEIKLEVIKIENTSCSVKHTATTPRHLNSNIIETVTVEDNTNSACANISSIGVVTYNVTGISSLTHQMETATAKFVVDETGFELATNHTLPRLTYTE